MSGSNWLYWGSGMSCASKRLQLCLIIRMKALYWPNTQWHEREVMPMWLLVLLQICVLHCCQSFWKWNRNLGHNVFEQIIMYSVYLYPLLGTYRINGDVMSASHCHSQWGVCCHFFLAACLG
jgi:hypothetical protein